MDPTLVLGPDPIATGEANAQRTYPATLFLSRKKLVTLTGTHFMQALAFRAHLDEARSRSGEAPLTDAEWEREEQEAVALYFHGGYLELPTTRDTLAHVFQADVLLQRHFPKNRIRFLSVGNLDFLEAIRRQGGLWRVTPRPHHKEAMIELIQRSRNAIGLTPIYFYNPHLGTRHLTCGTFASLGEQDDASLARHLAEVREYLGLVNRQGEAELVLWPAPAAGVRKLIVATDWERLDPEALRTAHGRAVEAFLGETPLPLRRDGAGEQSWTRELFCSLVREPEAAVMEQPGRELGPEFIYQIRWLPGATSKGVECVLDSILDAQDNPEAAELRDDLAIQIIKNVAREFSDLEYVNIGRIVNRLRGRGPARGRRDVFLIEFKRREKAQPELRVIRFQKYGIREHLCKEMQLLDAILKAEDYAEYIYNRRLGCRQLGMNLPWQFTRQHIPEEQPPESTSEDRRPIWATYFERDFIHGTPSPELSEARLEEWPYAEAVARLLGGAAAVNLIVGRVLDESTTVTFDEGNEVLLFEDDKAPPTDLVFCHHEGSFGDYTTPLKEFAEQYAGPVNRRAHLVVPRQRRFAEAYLEAFRERFSDIQREYHQERDAFRRLFASLDRDPNGNFGKRWDEVLDRLEQSDPDELTREIRRHIRVFTEPADASRNADPASEA